jgi:hypothetical protein
MIGFLVSVARIIVYLALIGFLNEIFKYDTSKIICKFYSDAHRLANFVMNLILILLLLNKAILLLFIDIFNNFIQLSLSFDKVITLILIGFLIKDEIYDEIN